MDDLGWANVQWHREGGADGPGNNEYLTPNLAALARNGTILDRMYGCVLALTLACCVWESY